MSDTSRPGRRLKVTLIPRNEADDESILRIVRQALEDGQRTPAIGTAVLAPSLVTEVESVRRSPISEKIEENAREAIEDALGKVAEQAEKTGQPPKFDPAKWVEQLSKVWQVIRQSQEAGVKLTVAKEDPSPPAAE
ncbi:hypothetical protein [Limnoglobus roseus]|uniref:Uncharacterized protein n=1 Tax=Limnoglobus roseus TaxID=2598579 RepID=A0A5C1A731_9BACT|nr:hypothetical protein [Limnoglobus roseus]QEL14215.1 hypothetical protein PX52LOC_01085 [Limnoglobus roseus]